MKQIIMFMVFGLFLFGCSDLLEKEPQGTIDVANGYLSEEDGLEALTAAYNPLTRISLFGGYQYWLFGNNIADDALKGGESGADQIYAQQIADFNISPTNHAIVTAWSTLYVGIRRANLVLDNVVNIEMNPDLKDRLLAEAKFLRGYYYFLLVQTFGDVPLVLESELESYDKERSDKDVVLDQIITDFEDAADVLPLRSEYPENDYGRVTKGAAYSYLGKVYLFMNDFTNAEIFFKEVIDSNEYSLDSDYYKIFTVEGETSPEIIFSIRFNYDPPHSQENPYGVMMGSNGMYGWGFNCPTQDFVDSFEDGDPRLSHSVYKNGDIMPDGLIADVDNAPSGYLNKKGYVNEFEQLGGSLGDKDLIVMRLGKVLLWYAEAANENGNTQDALDALNQVRERAREGDSTVLPDITETNQTVLRNIIWNEQRVEYGQEFERFFDLVRTGRAGEVLRAYAEKYNTSKGAGFEDGVHEIMPIPQNEINLSEGKITQNSGY